MVGQTALAVILKLFIGSAFHVMSRSILRTCSEASDAVTGDVSYKSMYCPSGESAFDKSIFVMTVASLAMIPALCLFFLYRRKEVERGSHGVKSVLIVGIPSSIDIVSTVLSTYGQTWIAASLAFVLKGGRVVFSAILSRFLLKR